MKLFKSVIVILLCLIMVFGAVSCGQKLPEENVTESIEESGTVTEGNTESPAVNYVLNLVVKGKSDFAIVYPRLSNESVAEAAESLAAKIKEYTGADIKVHDDSQKSEYEILIDSADRKESLQVYNTLREKDYKIQVFEKKLVICGGNADALKRALSKFSDKVIYARGKKGSTDRSIDVSSADDYFFAYKYAVPPTFTVNGKSLKEYTLIYDNGSVYAEYGAHVLKRMILEKVGYNLEVYADCNVSVDNEILVGMTERTTGTVNDKSFVIEMQGNKLCAKFNDLIGQEQAVDYFKDELFNGKTETVKSDFSKTVDLTQTLTGSERSILGNTGDIRIITTNIYQAADFYVERMRFLDMIYSDYAPDVILLQEAGMVSWTKSETKSIHALLASRNYETVLANAGAVRAEHDDIGIDGTNDKHNATPVVYNKTTLELLDSGYHVYSLENNSHSKSYTWSLFKVKATGKTFITFSTHLMYTPDASQDAKYEQIRVQNCRELIAEIKPLVEKYNCPAFGGGDINGYISSEHCQLLMNEGFKHVRDIAAVQDSHLGTCSPMHAPDSETGFFFEDVDENAVSGEIDLLFAYGNSSAYDVLVHDILIHDFAIAASDHAPVLIDVKLN